MKRGILDKDGKWIDNIYHQMQELNCDQSGTKTKIQMK